jgi:hypothetical protein
VPLQRSTRSLWTACERRSTVAESPVCFPLSFGKVIDSSDDWPALKLLRPPSLACAFGVARAQAPS